MAGNGPRVDHRDDYGRIAEFDALFIRETTSVNHHTYRFARAGGQRGLVVIDDPQSIVRCTNKVYLAELLARRNVPTPRTIIVHRDNVGRSSTQLGFPCVLKKPDSSFSQGVVKVENEDELAAQLKELFDSVGSDDRPGVLAHDVRLADRHSEQAAALCLQVLHGTGPLADHSAQARWRHAAMGGSEVLPVEVAPRKAVQTALKAANLIGDGLYGVDIKQSSGNFYVIEVNDNPNIDAGVEDKILEDELYRRIMAVFLRACRTASRGPPNAEWSSRSSGAAIPAARQFHGSPVPVRRPLISQRRTCLTWPLTPCICSKASASNWST